MANENSPSFQGNLDGLKAVEDSLKNIMSEAETGEQTLREAVAATSGGSGKTGSSSAFSRSSVNSPRDVQQSRMRPRVAEAISPGSSSDSSDGGQDVRSSAKPTNFLARVNKGGGPDWEAYFRDNHERKESQEPPTSGSDSDTNASVRDSDSSTDPKHRTVNLLESIKKTLENMEKFLKNMRGGDAVGAVQFSKIMGSTEKKEGGGFLEGLIKNLPALLMGGLGLVAIFHDEISKWLKTHIGKSPVTDALDAIGKFIPSKDKLAATANVAASFLRDIGTTGSNMAKTGWQGMMANAKNFGSNVWKNITKKPGQVSQLIRDHNPFNPDEEAIFESIAEKRAPMLKPLFEAAKNFGKTGLGASMWATARPLAKLAGKFAWPLRVFDGATNLVPHAMGAVHDFQAGEKMGGAANVVRAMGDATAIMPWYAKVASVAGASVAEGAATEGIGLLPALAINSAVAFGGRPVANAIADEIDPRVNNFKNVKNLPHNFVESSIDPLMGSPFAGVQPGIKKIMSFFDHSQDVNKSPMPRDFAIPNQQSGGLVPAKSTVDSHNITTHTTVYITGPVQVKSKDDAEALLREALAARDRATKSASRGIESPHSNLSLPQGNADSMPSAATALPSGAPPLFKF